MRNSPDLAEIPCLVGLCTRGNDHDFIVLGGGGWKGGGAMFRTSNFSAFPKILHTNSGTKGYICLPTNRDRLVPIPYLMAVHVASLFLS